MFTKKYFRFTLQLLITFLAVSLLVSACSPAAASPGPTATSMPVATLEPAATMAPEATAVPPTNNSLNFSLDTGSMATGFQTETVTAVSASDAPYWEVLPEYTRVTLEGYPISNHLKYYQEAVR